MQEYVAHSDAWNPHSESLHHWIPVALLGGSESVQKQLLGMGFAIIAAISNSLVFIVIRLVKK